MRQRGSTQYQYQRKSTPLARVIPLSILLWLFSLLAKWFYPTSTTHHKCTGTLLQERVLAVIVMGNNIPLCFFQSLTISLFLLSLLAKWFYPTSTPASPVHWHSSSRGEISCRDIFGQQHTFVYDFHQSLSISLFLPSQMAKLFYPTSTPASPVHWLCLPCFSELLLHQFDWCVWGTRGHPSSPTPSPHLWVVAIKGRCATQQLR
jgi:hypothetical protein